MADHPKKRLGFNFSARAMGMGVTVWIKGFTLGKGFVQFPEFTSERVYRLARLGEWRSSTNFARVAVLKQ